MSLQAVRPRRRYTAYPPAGTRYGVPSQFLAAKLRQAAAHLERERAQETATTQHEAPNGG